jgi:outer membrane protein OmpA-like peptidoglycan-associated protein/ABC-type amino acid transport substrate-binding protein
MSVHVKVFVALLIVGTLGILGYRFALPLILDAEQRQTSDAAATRGRISIGVDNWIGYFPLCSPEMSRRLRGEGWALRCDDDGADYAARMKKLAAGEIDFAVASIDAFLLNGAPLNFPGTIVAVIDESKGGDAIVARRSVIASLDALKTRPDTRIAYTPASPSEHLLKSIATHFDLPQLRDRRGRWRVEADGSTEALAKLRAGEADVAVLWEPDVSRALASDEFVKLIGTGDTDKLIVDVLIASRKLVQDRPEVLASLLAQYFQTLRFYGEQPGRLSDDVRAWSGLDAAQVEAMLAGVRFATLNDNGALWFGITAGGLPQREGLVEAIDGTLDVLRAAGDFDANPLPDEDPYRITNRQFIAQLYLAQDGAVATPAGTPAIARRFAALDDAGWSRLVEVGTLKLEPIGFQRGTATLDDASRASLAAIAERLGHYPNYRLLVKGHTGLSGDPDANRALSAERARAVAEYFVATYDVDPNRIRALGFGASQPLPRLPDESDRAYGYRLPRVEFALVGDRL